MLLSNVDAGNQWLPCAPSCLALPPSFSPTPTPTTLLLLNSRPGIMMDSPESPFSNLDVWCDWNGDVDAPVEVTVSVEVSCESYTRTAQQRTDSCSGQVWCTPNTQLPVLNTQSSSIMQVVEYGLHPKPGKTDEVKDPGEDTADDLQDNTTEDKAPGTPSGQRMASLDSGYTDSDPGANTVSNVSSSGSVIVRSDFREESFSADSENPFCTGLWEEDVLAASTGALVPCKRSSKAASLPESVTDSERTYGGYQQSTSEQTQKETQKPSSSRRSKRPTLIPRPVSTPSSPNHVKSAPKIPLPPNSAPVLEGDYKPFEGLALTTHKERALEEQHGSEMSSPVTPKSSRMGLDLERLSKLSTEVSRGSPCDVSAVWSEPDSSLSSETNDEDSPPGGVAVVRRSSPILLPGPASSPHLVDINGVFYIRCPLDTEPVAYEAFVTFLLHLRKGRPRGWWELVVPGLPRLSSNDHGYVYFRTPRDQGIEVRTTHFKRHTLVESCLMAQFLIPSKVVIPFRLCDAKFYGFLRDFKVTQAIRAGVESDGESDVCLVKYHAVCSIDLIQRDFWAKECGLFIYIYGGPEGEFSCQLQETQQKLHTIHLDTRPDTPTGVSEVQIICPPSDLAMFAVAWEMELPRAVAISWMPRIKASLGSADHEETLQSEFEDAEASSLCELVHTKAAVNRERPQRRTLRRKPKSAWWKVLLRFCWNLITIALVLRTLYRLVELSHCCEAAKSEEACSAVPAGVDQPGETPIASFAPSEEQTTTIQSAPTPLPLRDRIDYWLGWKGPMQDERKRVLS